MEEEIDYVLGALGELLAETRIAAPFVLCR
jgi:hypothetical protein